MKQMYTTDNLIKQFLQQKTSNIGKKASFQILNYYSHLINNIEKSMDIKMASIF